MRTVWVAALFAFATACGSDPVGVVVGAERIAPVPAVLLEQYAIAAECLGADPAGGASVSWYVADELRGAPGEPTADGLWRAPRSVFLTREAWGHLLAGNTFARRLVQHEAIHVITGSGQHGEAFRACDPIRLHGFNADDRYGDG